MSPISRLQKVSDVAVNVCNVPRVFFPEVGDHKELKHLLLTQPNATSMAILREHVKPLPVESMQ